jgi:hypothetical protein
MNVRTQLIALGIATLVQTMLAGSDLTPVKLNQPPEHPPLTLVEKGASAFSICLMDAAFSQAAKEAQACIAEATGVTLPIVNGKVVLPAIVLGDCPEAKSAGLAAAGLPLEGFALKTTAEAVFIVGSAWGLYDFLERFVGARWYWPTEQGGRSIPVQTKLVMAPAHYCDAPVCRMRLDYPPFGASAWFAHQELRPLQTCLRAGNSWPVQLAVHTPRNWGQNQEYAKSRIEMFQLNSDGTRNLHLLCYGNPLTLKTYLEEIEAHVKGERKADFIRDKAISVSPNDMGIGCHCPPCRALWNPDGGQYGTASRILATFVDKLAREVNQRWPDMTIIYLPYLNYTDVPSGFTFPGNVEVELCGMPGMAQYKEPAIMAYEQRNIDGWMKATGRPVQNWHYSCWPADRIKAPYQYPHVIKDYYTANRGKVVGTFINGDHDHWPRHHISLYTWLKVLWNPEFDVDAYLNEYSRRMYGKAAPTVREIVRLSCDGWEKSRWPEGTLSPKAVYTHSFPKATVEKMLALLEQARHEVADDELAAKRLAYYAAPFKDFADEYAFVMEGKGLRPLLIQKTAEKPVVDGKLDDACWKLAEPRTLRKFADNAEADCVYTTEVRAVFTLEGVTFGLRMTEPCLAQLKADLSARDDALMWHQDCVELYLDVSGKNLGKFCQFIVTARPAVMDIKDGDPSWTCEGLQTAVQRGDDSWSMEVFIPFKSLGVTEHVATGAKWYGQVTRHRHRKWVDGKEIGTGENQKLNANAGGFNSNPADFSEFIFRE